MAAVGVPVNFSIVIVVLFSSPNTSTCDTTYYQYDTGIPGTPEYMILVCNTSSNTAVYCCILLYTLVLLCTDVVLFTAGITDDVHVEVDVLTLLVLK